MKPILQELKHWQGAVVAALGVWLAVSPWVPGLSAGTAADRAAMVIGLALVAAGVCMSHARTAAWGAWSGLVLGLAAAVAPWWFGAGEPLVSALNAVVTGLCAALLALWVGLAESDFHGWGNGRGIAH
jgi:hypothetical protein